MALPYASPRHRRANGTDSVWPQHCLSAYYIPPPRWLCLPPHLVDRASTSGSRVGVRRCLSASCGLFVPALVCLLPGRLCLPPRLVDRASTSGSRFGFWHRRPFNQFSLSRSTDRVLLLQLPGIEPRDSSFRGRAAELCPRNRPARTISPSRCVTKPPAFLGRSLSGSQ